MQSMWYYFKKVSFFPCWNSNQVFEIKDDFCDLLLHFHSLRTNLILEKLTMYFSLIVQFIITKNNFCHIFITNIQIKTYKKTYIYVIYTLFLKQWYNNKILRNL